MYDIPHEVDRLTEICNDLHKAAGTPSGHVLSDMIRGTVLTEFCDYCVKTSFDISEICDLEDFALNDLICMRRIDALKAAQVMMQKEIDVLEEIWPCYSTGQAVPTENNNGDC